MGKYPQNFFTLISVKSCKKQNTRRLFFEHSTIDRAKMVPLKLPLYRPRGNFNSEGAFGFGLIGYDFNNILKDL